MTTPPQPPVVAPWKPQTAWLPGQPGYSVLGQHFDPAAQPDAQYAAHAQDLIKQALAGSSVGNADLLSITPLVVSALHGGIPDAQIIARLQNTLGVSAANKAQSAALDAALPLTGAPTAAGAAPAVPGGAAPVSAGGDLSTEALLAQIVRDAGRKYGALPDDTGTSTAKTDALLALQEAIKQADAHDVATGKQGGITEQQGYTDAQGAVNAGNANALAVYTAQMDSIREQLAKGTLDETTANDRVQAAVKGLQEARAQTDQTTTALKDFAPYGTTNGQTAFTPHDLGQDALARTAGMDPNVVSIRFPGVIKFNPQQQTQQNAQALGVTGALPTIPNAPAITFPTLPTPQAPVAPPAYDPTVTPAPYDPNNP